MRLRTTLNNLHLILLLLPFLSLLPLLHSSSDRNLVEQTCHLTPFYDICLSALRSSPTSATSDLHGLAQIIAGSVLQNANQTLSQIQQLLDRSTADPKTEQSLAYCAELYIPVVKYTLPQAIDALRRGRLGFAVYGISDAVDEIGGCQKLLSLESPVSEGNKLVTSLATVALAIIKLLQKGFF
ncbi:hypothetical protein SAY86_021176 [Trapa natans]|uniref:Pectinesterase inhibitor domain-containing protein n=1 Tax=Trapa natans TaxID=22666 RepID=A0AAN7RCV9_TRANT|nr:hypothetical protein SAY86_021176 [Trapa natans]